jgi:hypothetical protein
MQTHPTVSEGQSLPPLPQEDWKALHYAAVISDGKNIALLGIGDTVAECRDNVLKNMISAKVAPAKIQTLSKSLAFINHNETVLIPLKNKIQKLGIYYCESKVFIYAQRYGVYGMKLNYDLYTESPLIRFAGYDEGHRTAAQFKFNF